MIHWLTPILFFFAGALTLVELLQHKKNPRTNVISNYFTGNYSWLQRIAFIVLAVALAILATHHWWSWFALCLYVMAAGLVGVCWTDSTPKLFGRQKEHIHVACAGLAFGAAAPMAFIGSASAGMYGLAAAYVVAGALAYYLVPKNGALLEKIPASVLIIWLIVYSL